MPVQWISARQDPQRWSLTWQGPVHHGKVQNFAEFTQFAGSFLSHYIADLLAGFRFTLSSMHATSVIFPGKSVVSQVFSP